MGGCYLSVVAPLDYEITSSFPLRNVGSTNEDDEDGWDHLFNDDNNEEEEEEEEEG